MQLCEQQLPPGSIYHGRRECGAALSKGASNTSILRGSANRGMRYHAVCLKPNRVFESGRDIVVQYCFCRPATDLQSNCCFRIVSYRAVQHHLGHWLLRRGCVGTDSGWGEYYHGKGQLSTRQRAFVRLHEPSWGYPKQIFI